MRMYATAYVLTLDGALSAETAGYSKKSANDISKRLQQHPAVRALIDKGLAEREQELKHKAVKAMEHAYAQATVDLADLEDENGDPLPLRQIPRETRRAIASVEYEYEWDRGIRRAKVARYKLHDKRASQELFVKYAGKLKERVEVEGALTLEDLVPRRKAEGE